MQELPPLNRVLLMDRLPDKVFNGMPEAWVLALDSWPVKEWPNEMVEYLKDYLPQPAQTDE